MGMGDQGYATKFRDIVHDIAVKAVESMRPESILAEVEYIDLPRKTIRVLLPGETNPLTVKCPYNLVPGKTGDIVRVIGKGGQFRLESIVSGVPSSVWSSVPWIAPILLNGWTNHYDLFPDSNNNARAGYRIIEDHLEIKGLIYGGTSVTAFQLPVEFRPEESHRRAVWGNSGPARMDVLRSGDVTVYSGSDAKDISCIIPLRA